MPTADDPLSRIATKCEGCGTQVRAPVDVLVTIAAIRGGRWQFSDQFGGILHRCANWRGTPGDAWYRARARPHGASCAVPGCTDTRLTRDHIVPRSQGGTNAVSNIQILCLQHNNTKADMSQAEFQELLGVTW